MSKQVLRELIERAVADYGFRLALMWGPEDVIAASALTAKEADVLRSQIVPELKRLPDPVEPGDQPAVNSRLTNLASIR